VGLTNTEFDLIEWLLSSDYVDRKKMIWFERDTSPKIISQVIGLSLSFMTKNFIKEN